MKITIEFIPHLDQRYNTCGDWSFARNGIGSDLQGDDLSLKISETGNWKWNACILIHELVEALACKANGVTQEQVDSFDIGWKPNFGFEEPGEDPRAPYFTEHGVASMIEEQLFDALLVDPANAWTAYEKKLAELTEQYELREKDRLKHE
jgi:hypothetical protein